MKGEEGRKEQEEQPEATASRDEKKSNAHGRLMLAA